MKFVCASVRLSMYALALFKAQLLLVTRGFPRFTRNGVEGRRLDEHVSCVMVRFLRVSALFCVAPVEAMVSCCARARHRLADRCALQHTGW